MTDNFTDLETKLSEARDQNDREAELVALEQLAAQLMKAEQDDRAISANADLREVAQALGRKDVESLALLNLGVIAGGAGDDEQALKMLNEALQICRENKDQNGEALTLIEIGIVILNSKGADLATATFEEALIATQASGDRYREGMAHLRIGNAQRSAGAYAPALASLEAAQRIMTELGDQQGVVQVLLPLGDACFAYGMELEDTGRTGQANEMLHRAKLIYMEVNSPNLLKVERALGQLHNKPEGPQKRGLLGWLFKKRTGK